MAGSTGPSEHALQGGWLQVKQNAYANRYSQSRLDTTACRELPEAECHCRRLQDQRCFSLGDYQGREVGIHPQLILWKVKTFIPTFYSKHPLNIQKHLKPKPIGRTPEIEAKHHTRRSNRHKSSLEWHFSFLISWSLGSSLTIHIFNSSNHCACLLASGDAALAPDLMLLPPCSFWTCVVATVWLDLALAILRAFCAFFASPSQDTQSGIWGGGNVSHSHVSLFVRYALLEGL